jgi:hypothetical protein
LHIDFLLSKIHQTKKFKMGKDKKEKKVYFSQETFSKRFEKLYENKKFSDFTIKFEGKEDSFFGHKFVFIVLILRYFLVGQNIFKKN